jgi:hypothetical protein
MDAQISRYVDGLAGFVWVGTVQKLQCLASGDIMPDSARALTLQLTL